MRRALGEALYVSKNRKAFGKFLIDLPLMRPQLSKMMLSAEQARTVMFQAAEALRRSDAKEEGAYALTRLLTPLLKFRACRDARKVTGDALEVRGGCGYIEEWGDPRILRDAHLGSVWEGTSNIVALDVIRAIKREGSLSVWNTHLDHLIKETKWHSQALSQLIQIKKKINNLIDMTVMNDSYQEVTRQVASSMYRLTAAVAMAWEASRSNSVRRMTLAQLTLIHQLSIQDPLTARTQPNLNCLFDDKQAKGDVSVVNLFD
jgi:acyl-CoA dehydrogenase